MVRGESRQTGAVQFCAAEKSLRLFSSDNHSSTAGKNQPPTSIVAGARRYLPRIY